MASFSLDLEALEILSGIKNKSKFVTMAIKNTQNILPLHNLIVKALDKNQISLKDIIEYRDNLSKLIEVRGG